MARVQATHVDLGSIDHVSSLRDRRRSGFDITTITKVLMAVVGLAVLSVAGAVTAAVLIFNTTTTTSSSTTTTTSSSTTTTTSSSTTTTTSTTTTSAMTTAALRVFALSQAIDGQTVTCSSVVNSNPLFTQCNDLQQGGLYAPNGIACMAAWSSIQSSYWSTIAFCQAFVNSTNTYIEAFYDCNTPQTRFTWSAGGIWGTVADNGYTKNLRCYY